MAAEAAETLMSIAEKIRQEGRQEGREEGQRLALARQIATFQRFLKRAPENV